MKPSAAPPLASVSLESTMRRRRRPALSSCGTKVNSIEPFQLAAFWQLPKSSTPSAAEPGPTSRSRPSTASRLGLSRLR